MWAYVKNNKIQEIIRFPKPITIDNIKYPSKIFTVWTWTELNAIGIYTVEGGTKGDNKFQNTSEPVYAFDSSKKKITTKYTLSSGKYLISE